jgi:hypothetical protein
MVRCKKTAQITVRIESNLKEAAEKDRRLLSS